MSADVICGITLFIILLLLVAFLPDGSKRVRKGSDEVVEVAEQTILDKAVERAKSMLDVHGRDHDLDGISYALADLMHLALQLDVSYVEALEMAQDYVSIELDVVLDDESEDQ